MTGCVGCPTNHCADCPDKRIGGTYKGPCIECGATKPTELGRCLECANEIAFSTVAPDMIRTHISQRHFETFPSFTDGEEDESDRAGEATHEQLTIWESERWSEP